MRMRYNTTMLLCLAIFWAPMAAMAATSPLPATGQTGCWDVSGMAISCANTGQDGDKLKGAAWPIPRFSDNGDQTVTDNLTGLAWTKNGNPAAAAKSWQDALSYIASLNSQNYLGHNDWRLPNRRELLSLVNRQQANNALWLAGQGFSNVQFSYYWSSNTHLSSTNYAWYVSMVDGFTYRYDKGGSSFVWPVRAGLLGASVIAISPSSRDFGSVTINSTSGEQLFTISNTGSTNLRVSAMALTGGDSSMFALTVGNGTSGTCGTTPTINPAGSCTFSATFTPHSPGAKTTTLRITSNAGAAPDKDVALNGTGAMVTYTIGTAVSGGYGGISCTSPIVSGMNSICTITPSAGYHPDSFTDNGVDRLSAISKGGYTVTKVTADHIIVGTFSKISAVNPVTINNGSSTTSNPQVTLTLSYPGAVSMRFLIDNAATWSRWTAFTPTKSIRLPVATGQRTVSVRFRDAQGSESTVYSAGIYLDAVAPVGSISIESGAGSTTSASLNLRLSASDSSNGPIMMRFCEDGKSWQEDWADFSPTASYTLGTHPATATVAPGLKKVYVQFRDAGLKVSRSYFDTISYAASLPIGDPGQVVINNGATYTTTPAVTLAFTAPGGEQYVHLSSDGTKWGKWLPLSSATSWKLSSGDGVKTVYAQFSPDQQTASSTYSAAIILDTIAPVGWLLINNGDSVTVSASVSLSIGASDVNGVARMCIKETGAPCLEAEFEDYAASKDTYTFQNLLDGKKMLYISFKDSAGKVSKPFKAGIVLDTTAPTGSIRINNGRLTTSNAIVSLSFTASKAVYMQLSMDGTSWGEWESFVATKRIALSADKGLKSVKVRYKDFAEYESPVYTATITLQ